MKKNLLALAVLGALATAAYAQTNVTVYGLVDVALTHARSDTSSTRVGMDSGIEYGSRLGFKGTEDLGGGVSASFQLENGFNVDDGTLGQGGRIFGRQAWLGLNGGFGSVKLGRQWMPAVLVAYDLDPFVGGMAGNASEWLGGNVFNNIDIRMSNTINYSVSASGFSGQLAYGLGEVPGNSSGNRQIGLSLGYANGPVQVLFGHHKVNDAVGTGGTKTSIVGGTYNLGVMKAYAGYSVDKTDAAAATIGDAKTWLLGASAPVGAGNILASYIHRDDKMAANTDANQIALGYTHALSKRTNFYTSYARVNANSVKKFNAGIRHTF